MNMPAWGNIGKLHMKPAALHVNTTLARDSSTVEQHTGVGGSQGFGSNSGCDRLKEETCHIA